MDARLPLDPGPTSPPAPPAPIDKPVDDMSVDELAAAIRYHNHRYFALADPIISDYAFDALTRRLKALAPAHPALAELTGLDSGERLFHDTPMLSLDKAYSAAEVEKWAASFEGELIEAPKIDGVAASLKYDASGRLVAAITRGDGTRGEVFTANALYIDAIPRQLDARELNGPLEVRGEVYLPLPVFRERFEQTFSNPRNTCVGGIKQKEPHKTADYSLSFYVYSVKGRDFATLSDALTFAAGLGLPVVPWEKRARDDIERGYQAWLARRPELHVELDGVVYTADRLDEQRRLGETSHHPRWAIAYKFQGESGTSKIVDIEWSVSRSGAITPVAIIEPVTLSGATVTRCSLHNLAILRTLGANIGASVVAMRRGGVIPHIESVISPGPDPVKLPETCPVSGHATVVDGDFLMCSEPHHCPAARLGTLEYWLKQVEIDGFGPKILAKVVEQGWVEEPADFYRLTVDQLENLERLGRKSAQNLVDNIQARRTIPLSVLLASLGVADLGAVAARKLAEHFGSLSRVLAAAEEDIAHIHGLGALTARSIRAGLDTRRDLIDGLTAIVTVEDHTARAALSEKVDGDPVAGHSFVFTGKLSKMKREEAQEMVRARGGLTPDDVSKKLDYLVVADDGKVSSKQKKADKLIAEGAPLKVLSEDAFLAMMADP